MSEQLTKDSPAVVELTNKLLGACSGYSLEEITLALENFHRVAHEKSVFIKKEDFDPKNRRATWPHLWEKGAWPLS